MEKSLAVIATDGKQFTVTEGQKILVQRTGNLQPGSKVTFDKVLLLKQKENIAVGTPNLDGASVGGTVVGSLKTEQVVFKKKRRQGYQVKNTARTVLLQVEINSIKKK